MKLSAEQQIQADLLTYVEKVYPNAFIFCNATDNANAKTYKAKNVRGVIGQKRGLPDMYIEEPYRGYHGFRLELKADKLGPFHYMPKKKMLRIEQDNEEGEHLREQAYRLWQYQKRGYWAQFAEGFAEGKAAIDHYLMNLPIECANQNEYTFTYYDPEVKRYLPTEGIKVNLIYFTF